MHNARARMLVSGQRIVRKDGSTVLCEAACLERLTDGLTGLLDGLQGNLPPATLAKASPRFDTFRDAKYDL
jgi:hypothetical protein